MKVRFEEDLYVQDKDLAHLLEACDKDSIPEEVLFSSSETIALRRSKNEEEYKKFSGEEAIKFLDSLSFIVDFDLLRNMSWTETVNYGSETLYELIKATKVYESIADNKSEEAQKALTKIKLLRYRMSCIKELAEAKKGPLNISVPSTKKKKAKIKLIKVKKNNNEE